MRSTAAEGRAAAAPPSATATGTNTTRPRGAAAATGGPTATAAAGGGGGAGGMRGAAAAAPSTGAAGGGAAGGGGGMVEKVKRGVMGAEEELGEEGREGVSAAIDLVWRLLQVAAAAVVIGVLSRSDTNGMQFYQFQAFQFLMAAATIAAAWAFGQLLRDIGSLMPHRMRPAFAALLEYTVAWFILAGAAAAAGVTTFADRGVGQLQRGYCRFGLFGSFCARTKTATAFAFITFFFFLPTLISKTVKALRRVYQETVD